MSSTNTPFCPCCKSAGKSETEYTSHFVKDKPGPDGVVVCPTLLGQECKYCHEKGHTPKFCPKLANRGKTKRVSSYRSAQATHEMSANQRRQVEREARVFQQKQQEQHQQKQHQQQQLRGRQRCIDTILYEKRYWFDPLHKEEEIQKCLFAQTLCRLSDKQLANARGWVNGEERLPTTFHTWYNLTDEQEAMAEADREYEFLQDLEQMPVCLKPKLKRNVAIGVVH